MLHQILWWQHDHQGFALRQNSHTKTHSAQCNAVFFKTPLQFVYVSVSSSLKCFQCEKKFQKYSCNLKQYLINIDQTLLLGQNQRITTFQGPSLVKAHVHDRYKQRYVNIKCHLMQKLYHRQFIQVDTRRGFFPFNVHFTYLSSKVNHMKTEEIVALQCKG